MTESFRASQPRNGLCHARPVEAICSTFGRGKSRFHERRHGGELRPLKLPVEVQGAMDRRPVAAGSPALIRHAGAAGTAIARVRQPL